MTILFMDGFDHYGLDESNMSRGAWTEVFLAIQGTNLSTTHARTGTHSFAMSNGGSIRRAFKNGPISVVGIGGAVFFDGLPQVSDAFTWMLRDTNNYAVLTVTFSSTGQLRIYRGEASVVRDNAPIGSAPGTLLFESSSPVVVSGAWQHIEFKSVIDDTAGAVEVRVNELTIASLTGIDTKPGSLLPAQVAWACKGSDDGIKYLDDVFAWDTTGSNANDFLGDKRVHTLFMNSDTSVADYTVVGASNGFAAINEASPDLDTSYISFSGASDAAEFGFQNMPTDVSAVSAIQICNLMRKTNAGTAAMKNGFVSGLSSVEGAEHFITTEYTYWMDVFETDPATGALWTPAGVNSAKLRINRTV